MTRARLWLIGLAVAALVAVGVLLFPKLFKPVEDDLAIPFKGEAAYNSLYALKLALQAHGQPASSWPNVGMAERALAAGDTLLLFERPEAMGEAQAQRLFVWVQAGGHLLMPGPPRGASPGPLAERLGLRAAKPPKVDEGKQADEDDGDHAAYYGDCERVLAPGQKDEEGKGVWLCDARFTASIPGFRFAAGDERRGWRFARREVGRGLVTVVGMDFLDNRALRDPAARALAFQLLAPSLGRGRMHLVYSADVPSLTRLLVDHAWMVLLPLALALAAWLLFRGQRFGPVQPAPEPRRRALFEHVRAAGEFSWSRHRAAALHAAVLRLFQRRLQRRSPELFALSGEALEQALASATGHTQSQVREALRPQGLQHRASYTQSIATLLSMRSKL